MGYIELMGYASFQFGEVNNTICIDFGGGAKEVKLMPHEFPQTAALYVDHLLNGQAPVVFAWPKGLRENVEEIRFLPALPACAVLPACAA